MHVNVRNRLLAGAAAVALSAWACNNATTDRDLAMRGTSGTASVVNLTGCLQQSGGMLTGDYILTEVNHTNRPVGTGGTTASDADAVARAQHAAEANSFRLDGDNDQLRNLVGKQVEVSGRITDQADTRRNTGSPATTSVNPSDNNRDVKASDLARVKVESITKVSDSCGDAAR